MTEIFGIPTQALFGQLLIGLINGSFYAMLSLGLAVIFGLLNIINFTHGAQYMLGAFCSWLLLEKWGIGYWWSLLIAPLVVIGGALYFYFTGGRYQSTDDAYVEAAQMVISSNISGRVSAIEVRDNELVKKGTVLFRIDAAPFRIAQQEAQARLGSARLEVQALQATYRQRQAQLTGADETLAYEQREYDRQNGLLAAGISSQVQVNQLRHALDNARQARNSAREELAAVAANLGGDAGISIENHPSVLQARAALDRLVRQ